jgi:hypothetical protein
MALLEASLSDAASRTAKTYWRYASAVDLGASLVGRPQVLFWTSSPPADHAAAWRCDIIRELVKD